MLTVIHLHQVLDDKSAVDCDQNYNTQIEEPCMTLQRLSNIYQRFNFHQSILYTETKAKECRDSDALPDGKWHLNSMGSL